MPSTQCPLCPVNDRICTAAQYVAMGHYRELAGLMMATRHRLCHDAQRRLKQINPQMPARDSRRGNSLADHFFIFKAAPSKVVTMACISPSLVM